MSRCEGEREGPRKREMAVSSSFVMSFFLVLLDLAQPSPELLGRLTSPIDGPGKGETA